MNPGPTGRSRYEIFAIGESRTRRTGVLLFLQQLLLSENGKVNKGWVRRVPATAVIPAARVMARIIGSKASVAGLVSS